MTNSNKIPELNPHHERVEALGIESIAEEYGIGYCYKELFSGRVVIPIHDSKGEITAYVGYYTGSNPLKKRYIIHCIKKQALGLFNIHRVNGQHGCYEDALIILPDIVSCLRLIAAGYKNCVSLTDEAVVSAAQIESLREVSLNGFDNLYLKIIIVTDTIDANLSNNLIAFSGHYFTKRITPIQLTNELRAFEYINTGYIENFS